MLARKLPRSSSQASSLLRTFTTSSLYRDKQYPRAPALGDIQPGNADGYNVKQQEFRDGLEAARKKKEQADRQLLHTASKDPSPTVTPSSSAPPQAEGVFQSLGLGSLSTSTGEARQAETDTTTKRKGPLSSLIYGTPEGRNMDKEMERSFSEVLARGKYVHSIVFHQVKPSKIDKYVELVGNWYPKMANMPENKVNLVGSWRTEVGDSDTFGLNGKSDSGQFTDFVQCTSGNINDILVIMLRFTTSSTTQNSPTSITS